MSGVVGFLLLAVTVWWGWQRVMTLFESENEADWGKLWLNRLDGFNRIFCRRFHR